MVGREGRKGPQPQRTVERIQRMLTRMQPLLRLTKAKHFVAVVCEPKKYFVHDNLYGAFFDEVAVKMVARSLASIAVI